MGLTINGGLTFSIETNPRKTKSDEDNPKPTEAPELTKDKTPNEAP